MNNNKQKTTTFEHVLEYLRERAGDDGKTRGLLFEKLIKSFLQTDELYSFKNVWLWNEYPGRGKRRDVGVDIVAEYDGGKKCAIQCKFYKSKSITKRDIDSFLEAGSDSSEFDGGMMLCHTSDGYGKNAQDALKRHNCKVLDFHHLANSNTDWPNLATGFTTVKPKPKFKMRPDQKEAKQAVVSKLQKQDRGKLEMACGTGKTFTALKIAEDMVGVGGTVLYAVPSITLMQQAIRDWSEQRGIPHRYVGVCSDVKISKDENDLSISELEIGVTTDSNKVAQVLKPDRSAMKVVFSTYQSMEVIRNAQEKSRAKFDLVICDEAHRTTGIEHHDGKDESPFLQVHQIKSYKKIFMTATPRIYGGATKTRARNVGKSLYSMDGEEYGTREPLYRIGFSKAVDSDLLADYQVIVFGVDQEYASRIQNRLIIQSKTESGDLNLTDISRMIALYAILEKPTPGDNPVHIQTVINYANTIKKSKTFQNVFQEVANIIAENNNFKCVINHIDSRENASSRAKQLNWLRDSINATNECRIITNARCLSEGVDVPALDAISFLDPRTSEIDIIQAVGRVMRKSGKKKTGYVILPIAIPSDTSPEKILSDHEFGIVWNVLNALRSHDDNMDVTANTLPYRSTQGRQKLKPSIWAGGIDKNGNFSLDDVTSDTPDLNLGSISIPKELFYSRIVENVGDKRYFESWANDVAKVVQNITTRITTILQDHPKSRQKFDQFIKGLRNIINDDIADEDGVDMLAQHMVTRRIFNALFDRAHTTENPISKVMDEIIFELDKYGLETELKSIDEFYKSVETRVANIDNHKGRQDIIKELYGTFFKKAFPKMADKLGVVYTPVEIVNFILKSVDYALQENFGKNLSSKNVNVIDPFVGTGTFLARMLSSDMDLIKDKDVARKYESELLMREIVLLAYYIAGINIESMYAERQRKRFKSFSNIALADTFNAAQLTEFAGDLMSEPKKRIQRQRNTPITVIVSNPPYSGGQKTANEDNKNTSHPDIEKRIKNTYIKNAPKGNKVGLYNSYIKALRWASDRIGNSGIIGFITPSAYITGNAEAGIRTCLKEEFTDIWCFNLRGDVKNKEKWREEGGKIFGSGSTIGTVITILVKNPNKSNCNIHYKNIGNYLSREQKLEIISKFESIEGILDWEEITPDKNNDWINQRGKEGEMFKKHMPMGSKESKGKSTQSLFNLFSNGLKTHRDEWVYNSSYSVDQKFWNLMDLRSM